MEQDQINQILTEFMQLQTVAKQCAKRIDEIKDWCKEKGTFNTNKFVCAVMKRSRTGMVSIEKATKQVGLPFLEANMLIQVSEFEIVQVTEKAAPD